MQEAASRVGYIYFSRDQGCGSCTEAPSSHPCPRAYFHDINLQSLCDSPPPEHQQTTVLGMKWHNITESNIWCIRKVSAAFKPCNGMLIDEHLYGHWPPAQDQLLHHRCGGTATTTHCMASQGELKAKAEERHPAAPTPLQQKEWGRAEKNQHGNSAQAGDKPQAVAMTADLGRSLGC